MGIERVYRNKPSVWVDLDTGEIVSKEVLDKEFNYKLVYKERNYKLENQINYVENYYYIRITGKRPIQLELFD